MRGRTACLCALAMLGCKGSTLHPDDGELTFSPPSLDFATVYAGYPAQQTIALTYTGKAGCDVTLSATAPFRVTTSLQLAGSSASSVVVSLTASAAGALTGTLKASGCGKSATLALTATAMEPPECGVPGQCTTVAFDVDAGRCTTVQIADGTPCSDACLNQPQCHSGECVGTGKGCDDQDPCTLDACSADGGCVHVPADTFCPPLPNCVSHCDGGSCGSLIEVWNAVTPAGVQDPLVADPAGNIYWLEIDFGSTFQGWLVSRGRSGALRFRVAVDLINATPQPMFSAGVLVLSRVGSRYVTAFRGNDGSQLWERDLHDDVEQAGHPELALHNIQVRRGTVDDPGELVFPATFSFAGETPAPWMVALEPSTGATVWRAPISHEPAQLSADGDGGIDVWWPQPFASAIDSYDASGLPRWSSTSLPGPELFGHIYSSAQILDAASGNAWQQYQSATDSAPEVVTAAYGARRDFSSGKLLFFEPSTGATLGAFPELDLAEWDLYAATEGELIAVYLGALNSQRRVDGFDRDGGRLYSCAMPLEATEQLVRHTALVDNLLLVWTQDAAATRNTLHAYVMAARAEAPSGWTTVYGSMARTSRAR